MMLFAIRASFAPAANARPSAHVIYVRGDGAEGCPNEETLRSAVAARLGYDAFREADARTIRAAIAREKRGPYPVLLERIGPDSVAAGQRELTSASADCDEVFLAMTLAIAIAIDPMHAEG